MKRLREALLRRPGRLALAALAAPVLLLGGLVVPASSVALAATTIYVSTSGSDTTGTGASTSPYATIAKALSVAAAGDTILVEPGTYMLSQPVTITVDVTLESDAANGGSAANTILDAAGLPNGIVLEGPGADGAAVNGLTIENAQKAGLVAVSTSNLTIADNVLVNNDQSCSGFTNCNNPNSNNGIPPGQPGSNVPSGGTPFTATNGVPCGNPETGGSDCETLHLIAVTNSLVEGNTVKDNLDGGIYLTDEAGPTTGNTIQDNTVLDNQVDCGITLASHVPNLGVTGNTIKDNTSEGNGAAGIILATPVPGGDVSNNLVEGNTVTGNAAGGIDLHTHVANSTVADNTVSGNTVSGNGPDQPVTTVSVGIDVGASGSPITGTSIYGNTVSQETDDVFVTPQATDTLVGPNTFADETAPPKITVTLNGTPTTLALPMGLSVGQTYQLALATTVNGFSVALPPIDFFVTSPTSATILSASQITVPLPSGAPSGTPDAMVASFDQNGALVAAENLPASDLAGGVVSFSAPAGLAAGSYTVLVTFYWTGSPLMVSAPETVTVP